MNDIYDLIPEQKGIGGIYDDAYAEKYIHNIPDAIAVPRESFILELCRDKTVLHIGSNGVFNSELEKVAKKVYAIDNKPCDNNASNYIQFDIEERFTWVMKLGDEEIILASDILEHLSNPGLFLDNLKIYNCKILISVPNAFGKAHTEWTARNKENVHEDHVAYYSYNTLKCLIERYGFKIDSWYWYNGKPKIAEGIIFIMEKKSW